VFLKGCKADLAAGIQVAKVAPADPRAGLTPPPRRTLPEAGLASPPTPGPLQLGVTSSEVFSVFPAERGAPFWGAAPALGPQPGATPGSPPASPACTQTSAECEVGPGELVTEAGVRKAASTGLAGN